MFVPLLLIIVPALSECYMVSCSIVWGFLLPLLLYALLNDKTYLLKHILRVCVLLLNIGRPFFSVIFFPFFCPCFSQTYFWL